MRPSFLPRLINGPFDDPGLFVPLAFQKCALLFDLGNLSALTPGDLIKASHAFVSHTHMDHFIGFDQLLRLLLGRAVNLHLYGPSGFLKNVIGKLSGYTWNLVHNYEDALTLTVIEIHPDRRIKQVFECAKGFAPSAPVEEAKDNAILYEEPAFQVRSAILDHRVACLGFVVEERFHVNILRTRLVELGLTVGPWVSRFKALLYRHTDPATTIEVSTENKNRTSRIFELGDLSQKIVRITPGQKFAYIADVAYSLENQEKIIALVDGADHLFIEAAFLQEDCQTALEKYHLTAHQAGTLARRARVGDLTVFHHSPRYLGRGDQLQLEARQAFLREKAPSP